MTEFFRNNTKFVLFVIIVLTIGFAFMGLTEFMQRGYGVNDGSFKFYGMDFKAKDRQKFGKYYYLSRQAQLPVGSLDEQVSFDVYMKNLNSYAIFMNGNNMQDQNRIDRFIVSTVAQRVGSEKLGIVASEEKIIETIKKLNIFRTNGAYDAKKFENFEKNQLRAVGFTVDDFYTLIEDWIVFQDCSALLSTGVDISEREIKTQLEQEKNEYEGAFLKLNKRDFNIKITDEEKKEHFQKFGNQYKTQVLYSAEALIIKPKRGYSKLSEEKKLIENKRLNKIASEIYDLASPINPKGGQGENLDLGELAKKFKTRHKKFTKITIDDIEKQRFFRKKDKNAVKSAISKLRSKDSINHAQGSDGNIYIIKLSEFFPSQNMTFEQADKLIEQRLKEDKRIEIAKNEFIKLRSDIEKDLKTTRIDDIIKKYKLIKEDLPKTNIRQLSLSYTNLPYKNILRKEYVGMAENTISEVLEVPLPNGSTMPRLLYLKKITEKKLDKKQISEIKDGIKKSYKLNYKYTIYQEWIDSLINSGSYQANFKSS